MIASIDDQSAKTVSFSNKKRFRKHIMIVLHFFILALIQRFVDVTVFFFPYFNKFDSGKPMIFPTKTHARNLFFNGLNNTPSSNLRVNQYPSRSIEVDAQEKRMDFKSKNEKSLSRDSSIKYIGKSIQYI